MAQFYVVRRDPPADDSKVITGTMLSLHPKSKEEASASINWQGVGGFSTSNLITCIVSEGLPGVLEEVGTGVPVLVSNDIFTEAAWVRFLSTKWEV